jgi:hypothetical protein
MCLGFPFFSYFLLRHELNNIIMKQQLQNSPSLFSTYKFITNKIIAMGALCQLLIQGLDVDPSCWVQDWPYFLHQALELVDSQ